MQSSFWVRLALPALAAKDDDAKIKDLQAAIEHEKEHLRRMKADLQSFRIGGYSISRYGTCEMSLDLTHSVPGYNVVNTVSGIAEVSNGNRISVVRFSFEEA